MHDAIRAGIAYVSEDRKGLGLNLLDDIKTSITSAGLDKLRTGLVVDDREEVVVAEGYRKSFNIKAPNVTTGVTKLSGGNQQKVVLSKWMYTEPRAADPRRADARHRRRRQVRDLRDHHRPAPARAAAS